MTLDRLPPLRQVITRHGMLPKKSLGQNFILDLNLTAAIARRAGPLHHSDVLEIGPGPGGLTRGLLAEGARRVLAVEKDDRALAPLKDIADAYPGRLMVHHADALMFNPVGTLRPPIKVVANLPYNIATPLLTQWLNPPDWPPFWKSLTLMFQREVAQRIVAQPGGKTYGRLAVLAQWRCEVAIVMELGPEAFTPPPKVNSAVVQFLPRPKLEPADEKLLPVAVAAGFNQRRKMLRQSLKGLHPDIGDVLQSVGIEPTARAETVPVAAWCALSLALARG